MSIRWQDVLTLEMRHVDRAPWVSETLLGRFSATFPRRCHHSRISCSASSCFALRMATCSSAAISSLRCCALNCRDSLDCWPAVTVALPAYVTLRWGCDECDRHPSRSILIVQMVVSFRILQCWRDFLSQKLNGNRVNRRGALVLEEEKNVLKWNGDGSIWCVWDG